MDPRKAVLSHMLDARGPVLLVQSSEGAEALARKNGLTVTELLRPFAEIKEGTPFRTGSASFSLRGQRVRVIPAAEFGCAGWDASEAALARGVAADAAAAGIQVPGVTGPASRMSLPEITLSSTEDASRWLGKLKGADPAPWAGGYRRALSTVLRCLPTEQFECPAAVLVVVSTSDPDPVKTVCDLLAPGSLPRPFSAEQYDPAYEAAPRVVVLLSDKAAEKECALTARNAAAGVADGALNPASMPPGAADCPPYSSPFHGGKTVDPMAVIREVKSRFAQISVVGAFINTLATAEVYAGLAASAVDVWSAGMAEPLVGRPVGLPAAPPSTRAAVGSGQGASASGSTLKPPTVTDALLKCALIPRRGCCLAEGDVTGLRGMMKSLVDSTVVPALEARLYALQTTTGKQRAGLRGKIMSFIGSTGGVVSGTSPGTRAGSIIVSAHTAGSLASPSVGTAAGDKSGGAGSLLGGPVGGAASSAASSLSGGGSSGFDEGSGPSSSGGSTIVVNDVVSVSYPYATAYAQTRLLADLLLFVGDGDSAANLFRTLRDESKNDKTASHYAAASEGLALALLMKERDTPLSLPNREAESALESAANAYFRAAQASGATIPGAVGSSGPSAPAAASPGGAPAELSQAGIANVARRLALRLACRAAFALTDIQLGSSVAMLQVATGSGQGGVGGGGGPNAPQLILAANSRIKEAASFLRRMAQAEGDGSLAAALLTEQAGLACLRMTPVSHRRAAYHLATAGMLYGGAGPAFAGLAVRCLLAASSAVGDNPAAQLKPMTGASLSATDGALPWALISDHLCLHAAQRLLQLGNAEGAANTLSLALTTSAARLQPVVQRNMLRELVRAQLSAQAGKRAAHVKAAAERWAKKEKVPLPSEVALLDGSAEDKDAGYASGYAAVAASVPAETWEVLRADADKSSEAISPGLPVVHDGSLQVVSWSNAWAAAAAIEQVCTAAAPGMTAPASTVGGDGERGCTPLLLSSLPRTSARLWSADAAHLTATSVALQELGTGEGSVPHEGLWAGCLAGEGPVRPGETASGPGRNAWTRMVEAFARDVKAKEKAGGAELFRTGSSGTSSTGGVPFEWRKLCVDMAVAGEDEAEMAAKSHKSAKAAAWTEGGGPGHHAAVDLGAESLVSASALSLGPFVLGDSGSAGGQGVPHDLAHAVSAALSLERSSSDDTPDAGLDDINADAQVLPDGPAASALFGAASAMGRSAGSASRGSAAGGVAGHPPAAGASSTVVAAARAPLTGAVQQQLYHAAEVVGKAQERFVGEPITLAVTVTNPTGIELVLTGMRLLGEVKDAAAEGALTLAAVHATTGPGWSVDSSWGTSLATLSVDVVLGPGETRTLYLPAVPLAPGTLVIKGMAWRLLCGPGGPTAGPRYRHDFELKGPPLNDNKTNKASGARAADRRLEAKVKPTREWAGVRIEGMQTSWAIAGAPSSECVSILAPIPGTGQAGQVGEAAGPPVPAGPPLPLHLPVAKTVHMWEGETRALTLTLHNAGSTPIATAWVRGTGGGRVVFSGDDGALDGLDGATLPLDWAKASVTGGALLHIPAVVGSVEGGTTVPALAPGATASWTLHVRAACVGTHALRLLTLYSALPPKGVTSRAITAGALRAVRWCARVCVLPSLAALAVVRPSPEEAGVYDLTVSIVNMSPPVAGAKLPTGGFGAAGAAPVSLPLHLPSILLTSPSWTALATGCTTRTLVPLSTGGSASTPRTTHVGGGGGGGGPLPYLAARTLTYKLTPRTPQPTSVFLLSGATIGVESPPSPATGPAEGGLGDVDAPTLSLLRASHGQQTVTRIIATARQAEHARRRAAEAADALPPTLRSIRMAKAGGDGGGGEGEEGDGLDADPLPSSLQALGAQPDGFPGIGLLVTWARPASVMAAVVAGGTAGSGGASDSRGFLHIPFVQLATRPALAVAGSALRSAVAQLTATAALATTDAPVSAAVGGARGAAPPALIPGATPMSVGPFGADIASPRPPLAPSQDAPSGRRGSGAGGGQARGSGAVVPPPLPAPIAHALAALPLVASLTVQLPPGGGAGEGDDAHSAVPASFTLVLYHTGAGPAGHVSLPLDLALFSAGGGGGGAADVSLPPPPSSWAVADSAVAHTLAWTGPATRTLPLIKPGSRLLLPLVAMVSRGAGGDRLRAEAAGTVSLRVTGPAGEGVTPGMQQWLPILHA